MTAIKENMDMYDNIFLKVPRSKGVLIHQSKDVAWEKILANHIIKKKK